MGDPGGIGAEVIVKALHEREARAGTAPARWLVLGCEWMLREAAARASIAPAWVRASDDSATWPEHETIVLDTPAGGEAPRPAPSAEGGALSFAWVERAIALAMRPRGDARHVHAIVTGPISKDAWRMAGHGEFPGHTELLARRTGAPRHGMMFVSPALRAILVTAHVPLMKVGAMLNIERVLETIRLGHKACRDLGFARTPRIAVCGLNPHAGENGMLGDEDARVIAPAIERARHEGIDAHGPMPGDTVWSAAARAPLGRGEFDLVVAMYHDQALAPLKLVAWREAVNLTVGLPIVRTSPDHGTAFGIAGKNRADAGSMGAAMELAVELASRAMARASSAGA